MKNTLRLLLCVEFLFAFSLSQFGIHDHRKVATAVADWHRNQTPETKSEIDRQVRIANYQDLAFSAVIFLCLATLTIVGFRFYRKRLATLPAAPK